MKEEKKKTDQRHRGRFKASRQGDPDSHERQRKSSETKGTS